MSDASFSDLMQDPYLQKIRQQAKQQYIPIITPEVARFLSVIIRASRPERILEVGTAIGYSTIWMALTAGDGVEVVTIEREEGRARAAGVNFAHFGLEHQINLKLGDALEIIPYLRRKFDLVFIDAAKGQYPYFLEMVMDLVPPDGVIIADNVLYRGYVRQEGPIKHKRRTMINNLRVYLERVKDHPLLETSVIPLGDGLALSVKRGEG